MHRPRQQFDLARTYGWGLVWRAWRGDRAMQRAAHQLRPPSGVAPGAEFTAPVCFLTGRSFVHQTLFCAHSFWRHAARNVAMEFLSDGHLDAAETTALQRVFPAAIVRDQSSLDDAVQRALPPKQFPALHAVRQRFVLLRKLTDAMAGRSGYRLFFDSDMLFWQTPRELLDRAAAGEPLYLGDTGDDGYTANRAEITRALGVPIAAGVNSGLVGLDAGRIDWDLMERACAFLRESPGDQRLLEQTLWAIALGSVGGRRLDVQTYRVLIDPPQWSRTRGEHPEPVLLHYAWHSRLPYVASEWQRYLQQATSDSAEIP